MSHNPAPPSASNDLNEQGKRIQEIVEKIEGLSDPASRQLLQECMESVLSFYGSALERMLEVTKTAPDGVQGYDALINDKIVRGVLLIHGLHPISLETRLHQALDKVRPYMQSHGGNVELISLENDIASLRLIGHCKTCPSSAVTLELAVREAIEEACPDLMGFEVLGEDGRPLAQATPMPAREESVGHWQTVEITRPLADGAMQRVELKGVALLLCRLNDQFYAYRDHCPSCNMPLHLGELSDGLISCALGHRFDLREAGRSPDRPERHLDPFPLLQQAGGTIEVALSVRSSMTATARSETA